MSELPEGWVEAPIGDLCSLKNGRAFKPTEWSNDGLPIVRIQNLNDPRARFNRFGGVFDDRYYLSGDELLFAWSGTPGTSFGAHIWRGGAAVLNQHIFRVDFDSLAIDKRFFRYAINQKLNELIDVAHGGVGLRHVTKGVFEQTKVTVPPRNEQVRIADRLDSLLGRVAACRERLEKIPQTLRRFREAVLEAAVTGGLTEEWRSTVAIRLERCEFEVATAPENAPPLPADWTWVKVGTLASKVTDGVHKKPQYVPQGIPFITVKNLTAGPGLDFSDTKFVTSQDHKEFCRRTHPEPGDLLISKDGTLGVVRLIDTDRPFSIFVSVALIKPRDRRMSRYLLLALQAPVVQQQMVGVGSGLQHIHLRDLREDVLPLPPIGEQAEIVRRVDELFAFSDGLERRHKAAAAHLETLTPSLLAKAFRGELAPQDPNDEPASALLERIRATREETACVPKLPRAVPRKRAKRLATPIVEPIRAEARGTRRKSG